MLADIAQPGPHVGENEAQPTLIPQLAGQDLGLLHVVQDAVVLTERRQDDPRVEPDIDRLGLGGRAIGQPSERPQRLLEGSPGFAVGRSRSCAHGRLTTVRDRLVPQLSSHRMVGETLGVLGQAVRVERLDHHHDACMELTTRLLQEGGIRHLLGERVPEGVLEVGKEARFQHESTSLEVGETTSNVLLGLTGHRLKQRERHVVTDDSRRLEQALVLGRQAIDTRRQQALDAGRNLNGLEGRGETIGARFTGERLRLHESPDGLLDEERVAFRSVHQHLLDGIQRRIVPEQHTKEVPGVARRQRLHAKLPASVPTPPFGLGVGAVTDEQKHPSAGRGRGEMIDDRVSLGVGPVNVLHDEQ